MRILPVLVHGELAGSDLRPLIAEIGVGEPSSSSYSLGPVRVVLLVGKKYFLRTNDQVGFVLLAVATGATQRIDLAAPGGGSGVFGVTLGAGDRLESDGYAALTRLLASRQLSYEGAGAGSTPLP